MKPNVRMLVATDLGAAGDVALTAATTWLRRHGGTATALHVAGRHGGDASELARRVERVAGDLAARFEQRIEHGNVADRILEVARELAVDAIVVGGRDEGHARWSFGSVAEKVVTHSTCAVLVARAHAETGRVLALSDLSNDSLVVLEPARELARTMGTRPTLLHCCEPPMASESTAALDPVAVRDEVAREARERLRTLVGDAEFDTEVIVGSVVPTIVAQAEARDAEVVVMASRCRKGVARFFLGSVAAAVIREIHRSVLVIHRDH